MAGSVAVWPEIFTEIEWLLEGGVSPLLIPSIIGKRPETIYRQAWRYHKPYAQAFAFDRKR